METNPDRGVFSSLFDFEFSSLITTKIIKVVYVVFLVLVSLFALFFLLGGLAQGGGAALFALIFAPLGWFFYVVMMRLSLELVIVLFRIGDDVRTLAARGGSDGPPPAPPGYAHDL